VRYLQILQSGIGSKEGASGRRELGQSYRTVAPPCRFYFFPTKISNTTTSSSPHRFHHQRDQPSTQNIKKEKEMPPSRSIADATRFTPTIPHAFTRSPMPPSGTSSSATETPQQRVARLREAARMSKLAQASIFDRVIDRGRVWADKAHRVVALGLISATGLSHPKLVPILPLGIDRLSGVGRMGSALRWNHHFRISRYDHVCEEAEASFRMMFPDCIVSIHPIILILFHAH
jgi:hypothetical protein